MNFLSLAQATTTLRALAREQVTPADTLRKNLSGRSDLETLAHGLLRFDSLRTTHKKPEFCKNERAV